ncbi:hypothetical protein [Rivularia sp. PCC 7116]|uniref:hypothetical protein n=1 Tax=Rivularia sp. PCC 7116 TaxID=373994 RepID=UPI0005C7E456|nr:hypothetical protein [Rivularia sp. PCC 7116]
MKFFNCKLFTVASFLGVSTINLFFSQPALSAVSCERGTIVRHRNGSLASCILSRDTRVKISNNRVGSFTFACKAKNVIEFAQKSQFESCKLAEDIRIRKGNSVETCKKDKIVSVSTSGDSKNLSIYCRRSY